MPASGNTDTYVSSASFADDTSSNSSSPIKLTLTRSGTTSTSVTANIPRVTSASAGVAPKGAAVSSQSQSTKFLREDGSWAAPSYSTLSGISGVGTVSASGTAPLTLSASKSGTTVTISGSVAAATTSAAGIVTTASQAFGGDKTFNSTNFTIKADVIRIQNKAGDYAQAPNQPYITSLLIGDNREVTLDEYQDGALAIHSNKGIFLHTNTPIATYNAATTYNAGTVVFYNRQYYRNAAAIATPEEWTSGHWTSVGTTAGTLKTDASSFVPMLDNTSTLGTTSLKWKNVYATTFTGGLAGTASNAVTAGSAGTATTAGYATTAARAGTAGYATTAANAAAAGSAGSAGTATTAGYATTAARAGTAGYATTAARAGTAGYASNAASAAYATTAGNATDATKLPLAGGTMTGALTLNAAPTADLQAATKKYVDDSMSSVAGPMRFMGTLGTGGTTTSLASAAAGNKGYSYKVITEGTYQSQSAKVGDLIVSTGSAWIVIPSGDEPNGTVTNIATGSGLTGGPITTTGTISHATPSGASSGAKGSATSRTFIQTITTDGFGHVTGVTTASDGYTYTLPLASSTTRGGVKIGYTTDNASRNYAVQLDSEKMYVNVPWENTTYSFAAITSTLAWDTEVTIAAVGGVDIKAKLPVNPNTDTKVTQAAVITTAGNYPIILGYSTATNAITNAVNKTSTLYYNPSTKLLTVNGGGVTASTFTGGLAGTASNAVSAGSAGTATTAGYATTAANAVTANYAANAGTATTAGYATDNTKLPLAGGTMTGAVTVKGIKGTSLVDYGSTLPSSGSEGQLFFQTGADIYELPAGGTAGYALVKNSAADRDVKWALITATDRVAKAGDTMTGALKNNLIVGGNWIAGTHNGNFQATSATSAASGQYFQSWFSGKTPAGAWGVGPLSGSNDLYFSYGTDANFNSNTNTTSNIKFGSNGAVYGAVWNDYAEYRKDNPEEIQEPGRCVYELGNGLLALTTKRLERGCEIISDTFGFAIGQDENNGYNTPIASNGRVLAYPYESIEEFKTHIGWPVCSGPNGTVSIMTEEEEEKYSSRIVGIISEIPDYEEWGTGKVKVNGRIWIRVR